MSAQGARIVCDTGDQMVLPRRVCDLDGRTPALFRSSLQFPGWERSASPERRTAALKAAAGVAEPGPELEPEQAPL